MKAVTAGGGLRLLVLLCVFLLANSAWAEEEDLRSLELYNGGSSQESVSVGRFPRPASQTAENITVFTCKDIEGLNAHTLADVLFNVAGVEVETIRTPGADVNFEVQGSNYNHILVLIDNVPINNLADNFPEVGSIPVQMIERVEVVKGAASSSWGNALGGVINVITKSPQLDSPVSGMASLSAGKASTIDGRGEVTGTVRKMGYFLTGGKLRSDGLLPNNMVDLNHFYGKLHYELPRGSLSLTTALTGLSEGQLQVPTPPININGDMSQLLATLSVDYPLNDSFSVQAMYRTRRMESELFYHLRPAQSLVRDVKDEETSNGTVVKVSYLDDLQRFVAGVDYDHLNVHVTQPLVDVKQLSDRSDDRIGVYLNDTFTLRKFAITPSVRYDHTGTAGALFSPSFGVTYAATDNTVVRLYGAKGYSLTSLNRDNSTEKVWTGQIGAESADVPYVWLKLTGFLNATSDILVGRRNADGSVTNTKERQLKQGVEFEARTLPLFYTSLSVGYTFIDARIRSSNYVVYGTPRHTVHFGVKYEDSRSLRALLTGNYVDWNEGPGQDASYHDVIWDLFLSKKVNYSELGYVELFASVRNLFNGDYYTDLYRNPKRWMEVGIRCAF